MPGELAGARQHVLGTVAVLGSLGAAPGATVPMVAALALGAIAILALAIFLLVKFWSDAPTLQQPTQLPAPGPLPPPLPTPGATRTQLKLLVDHRTIDTVGPGGIDEPRLAFRIDEPPPGSRLLRYNATTNEWVPVPWAYDAARKHLIAQEPVGDASLWVLEERT